MQFSVEGREPDTDLSAWRRGHEPPAVFSVSVVARPVRKGARRRIRRRSADFAAASATRQRDCGPARVCTSIAIQADSLRNSCGFSRVFPRTTFAAYRSPLLIGILPSRAFRALGAPHRVPVLASRAVRALGAPHRVLVLASYACRAYAPVIARVPGIAFTIRHDVTARCRRGIRPRAV